MITFEADPDADARLAWVPGDTTASVIAPSMGGARWLTGGFLALMFGDMFPEGGRTVEDGFAFTMRAATWAPLREALMSAEPLIIPAPGPEHLGLSVEWIDE